MPDRLVPIAPADMAAAAAQRRVKDAVFGVLGVIPTAAAFRLVVDTAQAYGYDYDRMERDVREVLCSHGLEGMTQAMALANATLDRCGRKCGEVVGWLRVVSTGVTLAVGLVRNDGSGASEGDETMCIQPKDEPKRLPSESESSQQSSESSSATSTAITSAQKAAASIMGSIANVATQGLTYATAMKLAPLTKRMFATLARRNPWVASAMALASIGVQLGLVAESDELGAVVGDFVKGQLGPAPQQK
jgi:hypothetical protein